MGNTGDPLKIVSFKLPASLDQRLSALASRRGTSRSALVREALAHYTRFEGRSFVEAAGNLVGCLDGGPPDLSSNPAYLKDMGR